MAALAGCASTREQATIDRFVDAPRDHVVAAFDKVARSRGYTVEPGGAYQRITVFRKDPVLGLVTVSREPQSAMWLVPQVDAVTAGSSRLVLAPQYLNWFWPYFDKQYVYLSPGSAEHAEAALIVDATATEATSSYRASGAAPHAR